MCIRDRKNAKTPLIARKYCLKTSCNNPSTFLIVSGRIIKMKDIQLQSIITCPHCQNKTTEKMPTDYCQYFWSCPHCHKQLSPKEEDCCIYCSYGTFKCPPIQKDNCC